MDFKQLHKSSYRPLESAKVAHDEELNHLSDAKDRLDEQLSSLLASQPRSFVSTKVLDNIDCGKTAIELDTLEIESNGRPIAFFLAPADDPDSPTSNYARMFNNQGGGAATYIKLFRTHRDIRQVVASQHLELHVNVSKTWDGARLIGIDSDPPIGKAVYSLEVNANVNVTKIHNLRFFAFELPINTR